MKSAISVTKYLIPLLFIALFSCDVGDAESVTVLDTFNLRNGRTLAIDVNPAGDGDWGAAFAIAQNLGVDEIKQSWDWDLMETNSGFDFTIPDIANAFFPTQGMPVSLIFRPINTNLKSMPDDLKSLDLDDPILIERFNAFLDSIYSRTPNLQINSIYIGNEIDIYLGEDEELWEQFSNFFGETADHVKLLWGDSVKIGSIATLDGLTSDVVADLIEPIHDESDVVAITYYPLFGDFQFRDPDTVEEDFDEMVDHYGHKEIRFTECGYATGTANGSSEEMQREFVENVFTSWDKHLGVISHIDFTWMHDLSQEQTDEFKLIYGLSSNAFGEYLRTLGFRTLDGQDKLGFEQLKSEAAKRGW